jgi:hypothetical protein
MAGPSVYEDGLFELGIDPSENSLDNTFNSTGIDGMIYFPKLFPDTCIGLEVS